MENQDGLYIKYTNDSGMGGKTNRQLSYDLKKYN